MTGLDLDRNAWAGRSDTVPPNVELLMLPARDPLDGGDLGLWLDRLALHRGRFQVAAELALWLVRRRP